MRDDFINKRPDESIKTPESFILRRCFFAAKQSRAFKKVPIAPNLPEAFNRVTRTSSGLILFGPHDIKPDGLVP